MPRSSSAAAEGRRREGRRAAVGGAGATASAPGSGGGSDIGERMLLHGVYSASGQQGQIGICRLIAREQREEQAIAIEAGQGTLAGSKPDAGTAAVAPASAACNRSEGSAHRKKASSSVAPGTVARRSRWACGAAGGSATRPGGSGVAPSPAAGLASMSMAGGGQCTVHGLLACTSGCPSGRRRVPLLSGQAGRRRVTDAAARSAACTRRGLIHTAATEGRARGTRPLSSPLGTQCRTRQAATRAAAPSTSRSLQEERWK